MTGPGAAPMEIRETAVPSPGPLQVTVDVVYAGVNFADVMVWRGDHAYGAGWPYVPGLEVSGRIREVGQGVTGLHRGEPVLAYTPGGAFADVAVAGYEFVVPLAPTIDLALAATVPVTLSTAELLLTEGIRIRAEDRLLIHSAGGGLGLALAALARRHGVEAIVGTVGSAAKASTALRHGYDDVVIRGPGWCEQALRAIGGRGYTAVLSPLGTDLLADDLSVTAANGKVLRFGNAPGNPHEALPTLASLNTRNIAVGGFSRRAMVKADSARVARALAETAHMVTDGLAIPLVKVGGLPQVPELIGRMLRGETTMKHVVEVTAA
jgi:NADPH2:quinone reductase